MKQLKRLYEKLERYRQGWALGRLRWIVLFVKKARPTEKCFKPNGSIMQCREKLCAVRLCYRRYLLGRVFLRSFTQIVQRVSQPVQLHYRYSLVMWLRRKSSLHPIPHGGEAGGRDGAVSENSFEEDHRGQLPYLQRVDERYSRNWMLYQFPAVDFCVWWTQRRWATHICSFLARSWIGIHP